VQREDGAVFVEEGDRSVAPRVPGIRRADLALRLRGRPPRVPGSISYGAVQRLWSGADEFALLTDAATFRAGNGHIPCLPDMGELFDYLRGRALAR
jgi:hypothetical protein